MPAIELFSGLMDGLVGKAKSFSPLCQSKQPISGEARRVNENGPLAILKEDEGTDFEWTIVSHD